MSDDYDCTGTIGQQHCGSKGGVAVCNAQGRSAALESTLKVLVVEKAMWKVKICVERKCFYLPICKIVEVVMRCSVRLFADPWPTNGVGVRRGSTC